METVSDIDLGIVMRAKCSLPRMSESSMAVRM